MQFNNSSELISLNDITLTLADIASQNNSDKPISLNDITLTLADIASQNKVKSKEHMPHSNLKTQKEYKPVKINLGNLKYI
jgi:hypothetical protein